MRIAILMSTYNGEKYIREQIESILCQEGNFEFNLFVRDDGSTDSTKQILNEYSENNLLEWYEGENLGPALSFLDLLKKHVGYDYYAFADQDDYWISTKLEYALNHLDNQCPKSYFSNAELVDSNLKSLGRNVYKCSPKLDLYTLSCAGGILGCTTVINSKLAKFIQDKDLPSKIVMHDFYINLLCSAVNGKIIYDARTTMKYRQHENNAVGVSYGFFHTIKTRLLEINHTEKTSIADQSRQILDFYSSAIKSEYAGWLVTVSNYKKSLKSRIMLALSTKTKYINFNMGLKLRLSILKGNR